VKSENLTFDELFSRLAELSGELLLKTLPKWLNGEIKPMPQDELQTTYTKILTREDGKIDWLKSAEKIERQIRAFKKWPGTWCEWDENGNKMRLKILKSKVLSPATGRAKNKTPGLVFLTEQKELAVNCNPGSLILEELQLEGKNKISGKEFLRGHPKIIGSILK
jgi:methionyl-tRNA formyltransferase